MFLYDFALNYLDASLTIIAILAKSVTSTPPPPNWTVRESYPSLVSKLLGIKTAHS